ncbi:hypothetical protein V5O48_008832 [Marasmius crinis-equi]|uniref:AB hydrolase-1 domain-containing protein n=1 Tax=Marasmius crinis-equi TaxID=585013 RepID=A0ABR3FCU8_9AGAR
MPLSARTYTIIDDIKVFFTDTGAPPDSDDYTTLITIHGFGFSGACFESIQSQAHAYNLRVVALNRRGYHGSTPFSDQEIDAVRGPAESDARKFFERLGLHLSLFLEKFVREEKVPPVLGRGKGGIAVMGWSLGGLFANALFANPDAMSEERYELLEGCIKDLVLYDPGNSLGLPIPSTLNLRNLFIPQISGDGSDPGKGFDQFIAWVTSRLEYTTQDGIPTIESIEKTGALPKTEQNLADSLSRSEIERLTDAKAAIRSDMPVPVWQGILNENTQKVLFDEAVAAKFFPKLSITYLYAPHSVWLTVLAYGEAKKQYQQHIKQKTAIRPIQFIKVEGADHFVHYNDPQNFLKTLVEALAQSTLR